MPPAFILSQDQTLKFVSHTNQPQAKGLKPASTCFKEPMPAFSNVYGYEGQCSVGLNTGYRSLKIPGPGAVAHMSLHQKQQCQRTNQRVNADNNQFPTFTGNLKPSVCVGDQPRCVPAVPSAPCW